jgi:hypothetical protein
MKKGKILIVGLIALLMAGGLVLASCEECSCTVNNWLDECGNVQCGLYKYYPQGKCDC